MLSRQGFRVAGLVLLLSVLWPGSQTTLAQTTRVEPRLYVPPVEKLLTRSGLPAARARVQAPRPEVLSPLEVEALRVPNERGQIPMGVARPLTGEGLQAGRWDAVPGSRGVWRFSVRSPGAVSMRVHFTEFSAGAGSVWVYGADAEADGPYTGRGIHGDGEFWSATIPGDTAVIEYEPSEDALDPGAIPFAVREISHHWEDPVLQLAGERAAAKAAAACNLDYKCYQPWADAGQSVAYIRYIQFPYVYSCSGSLLSTRSGSLQPYFLTANHCLSTESQARSLETYFFYESQSCGGAPPSLSAASRINGASLLVTRAREAGDFTLLRLAGLPSRPVWFAGWDQSDLSYTRDLATIHHPEASYKRISFGRRAADEPGPGGRPADAYYQVRYSEGRTEFGSSGAPLFYLEAGSFYVVGALSFGDVAPPGLTVCDLSPFQDGFGRFSVMYPVLRPWLEDQQSASLFVTPSAAEFGVRGSWLDPDKRVVRVSTNSTSPVNFTASANASWIRLSRTSGSVSSASPADIDVSVDALWFASTGDYTAAITISALGQQKTVSVGVGVRGPRVFASSFRNAASFEPGLVAGSLATVTGKGLAAGIEGCVSANNVVGPWPTSLAGVEVRFGDHVAPIFAVCNIAGEEFVTVQTPFELGAGTVWARVQAGGEWVLLNDVPVLPVQPGVFEALTGGRLRAVIVKLDGSLVAPDNGL
ncbi:MAG TPA: hypothetical protein VLH09_04280, partial [Bryobacteraceae bacterium]|nr:hypothetical protein [Bryobacteraceae bacterium]